MMDEARYRRKLSDLSLIDDHLFGLFIQEAGSEEVLKGLIERMLDVRVSKISLKQKQHEISNDPDLHGIRLDAFVQEESSNTLYDIEVQTVDTKNIPKRMRFYQSLIDREQMPSGEFDYNILPKTVIIFVTDFDPFNQGLYRYTFENTCLEKNSLKLGDESIKVVLNTKGKDPEGVNTELIELLKYFHSSTKETAEKASSDFVKRLDKMLEPIKNSPKFGGEFMSIQEKLYTERRMGREEGIEVGVKKGREEGIQEGRREGRQEGRQEERKEIIEKMRKTGMTEEQIKIIFAN
ncbi:MAG: Rpn family recombination-promoting nuclease/putative transposase [Ruminiclostridium sp.]|nr:Rpn family recombination-promoting nuclease/putative transposase [Ruminiclostridium sp.]